MKCYRKFQGPRKEQHRSTHLRCGDNQDVTLGLPILYQTACFLESEHQVHVLNRLPGRSFDQIVNGGDNDPAFMRSITIQSHQTTV